MLATEGKTHIKRYLAGYVPVIAQSMSFGIGNRVEALTDMSLHLESSRAPINLTSYDFVSNKLVYKASVPEEYVGSIYEVGVYSLESDPAAGDFSSRTLSTFDSATEDWVNNATLVSAVFSNTTTRLGVDSLQLTAGASTSYTAALKNISLDLGGYSNADSFSLAYNNANAFGANLVVQFITDTSNYYQYNLGAQTAGYKIIEVTKGAATVTGAPNWSNITEIRVILTATAGGTAVVEFEAIRIEDKDAASLDYILIARKVLTTPITKVPGMSLDVEFSLAVTL